MGRLIDTKAGAYPVQVGAHPAQRLARLLRAIQFERVLTPPAQPLDGRFGVQAVQVHADRRVGRQA